MTKSPSVKIFSGIERSFKGRLFFFGAVLFVIVIALVVRMGSWNDMSRNEARSFVAGEPVLLNIDGYYYLSLARDLSANKYDEVNTLRKVPQHPNRPVPPPLLSVLAAKISQWSGYSLIWVAMVLPVALGITLGIPVYFLGRDLGGRSMGLSAALIALCAPYFAFRSSFGWFDTDCLNVTFITALTYLFWKISDASDQVRMKLLPLVFLVFGIGLWWWHTAHYVFVGIMAYFVGLVLLMKGGKYGIGKFLEWLLVVFCTVLVLMFQDSMFIPKVFQAAGEAVQVISGAQESHGYPSIKQSIPELDRYPLAKSAVLASGDLSVCAAALVGLVFLFLRKEGFLFFILPILILAALGFFVANRFLIFFAPIAGLGCGYLVSCMWRTKKYLSFFTYLSVLLALLLMLPAYSKVVGTTVLPNLLPYSVLGWHKLKKVTPKDAIIWSTWGTGYPIVYYAERATMADGENPSGEVAVNLYMPLITHNQRLSANYMVFLATQGTLGIAEFCADLDLSLDACHSSLRAVLSEGPKKLQNWLGRFPVAASARSFEDWRSFLFSSNSPDIYVYLDAATAQGYSILHSYGSWSFVHAVGLNGSYRTFFDVKNVDQKLTNHKNLKLNLASGEITIGSDNSTLDELISFSAGSDPAGLYFGNGSLLSADYQSDHNILIVGDRVSLGSVFNQLWLRQAKSTEYFQLVVDEFPAYRIWKVVSEHR